MITQKHAEANAGWKQIEDDRCDTGGTIQLRASGEYSSETLQQSCHGKQKNSFCECVRILNLTTFMADQSI